MANVVYLEPYIEAKQQIETEWLRWCVLMRTVHYLDDAEAEALRNSEPERPDWAISKQTERDGK